MKRAKPYEISKKVVWEAWKQVKANHGAAGVDEESVSDFEKNVKDNLYKIWNRMSSGSYFPPPVRTVEIPKKSGGERLLGIPTVADRVAQVVAKMYLEPVLEPNFHQDSYGYRPGKSAIQAVEVTRRRCWKYDWVLEFDIKGLFDNINHDLLMRAVRKHTDCKWMLLYIERWLKAPFQGEDGILVERTKGTPQGGVISPLLANLFLHYVFDKWMERNYPQVPFCRYADDGVVHCRTEAEAWLMKEVLESRFKECNLELHREKTRIIYCKDEDRRKEYSQTSFDFLGFTFRPRRSKNRWGKPFINFSPAVSNEAGKAMRQEARRWRLHLRSDKSLEDLSRMFSPIVRGWINYYGSFYKSALYPTLRHLNRTLVRWAERKFKRLRRHQRRAEYWLGRIAQRQPWLFPHWRMGIRPAAG
ncbi:MAG: group II intron reverse transcriptase/maturase [Deltaproteobacteria bacterium]|nr:group II intron reverse transcriptase/maturase [Deltaproteobacteria bacterium]MDP2967873.1 group II intron reverse transcriptase/maturase [Deltaproteobacteria bacterium]